MNEIWLHIGTDPSAARLTIKQVTGAPGVGLARLMFIIEATAKRPVAEGCPLLFEGRVETLGIGGRDLALALAPLVPLGGVPTLRAVGVDEQITMTLDIDDRQLQIIEGQRAGDLRLRIWLSGTTFREGQYEPFHANNVDYTISQSAWITILEQVGFTKKFLIEVDAGTLQLQPALATAYNYFLEARTRYSQGDWRHTVESLRQCLAALVGKKPEDEDSAADVQSAIKSAKTSAFKTDVEYAERFELVRQSAKFLCDLAAHPGSEETGRKHAQAAMVVTAGILESYRR